MLEFHKQTANDIIQTLNKPGIGIRFGQLGEDCYLWHLFKNIEGGFYVDVGAHDPTRFSNTYLLYKFRRWHGINIDANPLAIEHFVTQRPNDINLNVGISETIGEFDYFMFESAGCNTFDEKLAEKIKTQHGFKGTIKINTRPLCDILDEYSVKKIDFLNIDVEGFDLQALKSLNLHRYKPKLIAIEIHDLNLLAPLTNPIVQLLNDFGYKFDAYYNPTAFFRIN